MEYRVIEMTAKYLQRIENAKELVERVDTLTAIDDFYSTIPSLQNDDSSSEELLPISRRVDAARLQHARYMYGQYLEDAQLRDISGPKISPPPETKGEGYLEQLYAEFDKNDPNFKDKIRQRIQEAAKHTITLPIECMPPYSYQKYPKKHLPALKRLQMSAQDGIFIANRENDYVKEVIQQPPLVTGKVESESKLAEFYDTRNNRTRRQRGMQYYYKYVYGGKEEFEARRHDYTLEIRGADLYRIRNARERVPKVSYETDIQPRDLLRLEQNVQRMNKMGGLVKGYEFLYE